ncbi:MAG: FISUMP domain-containing protein [Flavobacteriales bacterium]
MKYFILTFFTLSLLLSSCKREGCTDPSATNYSVHANAEDGSCTYYIFDINLNSYNYKFICNGDWSVQNLRVKKYKNGDPIPQVQDATEWSTLTTGAWCYYDNDPSKGVLYNWYAVTDPRGLAPAGWHIPTTSEYSGILTCFGSSDLAKKFNAQTGWITNNGTNESGFTALPCGRRNDLGEFFEFGENAWWWTQSTTAGGLGRLFFIKDNSINPTIGNSGSKKFGFSVRVIRD